MTQSTSPAILQYLKNIKLPQGSSHKGQNGKLLIIGGSELFHAASKWSLDVASKFVDMLFYSSVPDNNELIKKAKGKFWNGIVVPRGEVDNYLKEADCVLIGPGMERDENTREIVNRLLSAHPEKKWVIDAGALQMVEPDLLNKNCIITPHQGELERVWENLDKNENSDDLLEKIQEKLKCTILLKGEIDFVSSPNLEKKIAISGGNAGMTKGGTGDVLSGLVAALYCTHDVITSSVVGSFINKRAGDALFEQVGPYFNASDLVEMVSKMMWSEISQT